MQELNDAVEQLAQWHENQAAKWARRQAYADAQREKLYAEYARGRAESYMDTANRLRGVG